ncbi:uncharacterized protein LOC133514639 [Syngnathoides biaculeatus]|uniref:uncharacterized protein LOC133514639 n=1 Tax=Syngnathoides biaculeatus TaxID=300417 RepID=UPI002ADD5763|nr:uncharacterized protein LOC133514639 [Syngnathoides biaculeatus]
MGRAFLDLFGMGMAAFIRRRGRRATGPGRAARARSGPDLKQVNLRQEMRPPALNCREEAVKALECWDRTTRGREKAGAFLGCFGVQLCELSSLNLIRYPLTAGYLDSLSDEGGALWNPGLGHRKPAGRARAVVSSACVLHNMPMVVGHVPHREVRGLLSVLCLLCTARAETVENNRVIWKQVGETVSFQCRSSEQDLTGMSLFQGLKKEFKVLYSASDKNTIAHQFEGRLWREGTLPNVDVVISNLTTKDTGVYRWEYEGFDVQKSELKKVDGNGPLLLVVTAEKQCAKPSNLLLVTLVVSAAVLFGVLVVFLLWIIPKIKKWRAKYAPGHRNTSDVYEDMRATLRP